MEEIKEKSIHYTGVKLCEELKLKTSYNKLYSDIQV